METPVHNPDIPWHIHRYDTVDSTQNLAVNEARVLVSADRNLPACTHFSAHIAHRQAEGRGQHARVWESPTGGLYLSAVIAGAPEIQPNISPLLAGLAVVRTIEKLPGITGAHCQIAIRWPNDILLDGKKLAGILTEGVFQGNQRAIVIGIGMNVNTDMGNFPPQIAAHATSLASRFRRTFELDIAAAKLLGHIQRIWWELATGQESGFPAEAITQLARYDDLHGRMVTVRDGDRVLTGRGEGFSEHGELLLLTGAGREPVLSGTVLTVDGRDVRAAC